MPYLSEFLILASIHFLAVVVPGPDFAVVVQNSISYGRKIGVITALGIGTGISVHVLYTILGFGLLLQTHPFIFSVIQIISALYLAYLGIQLIYSNLKKLNEADQISISTSPPNKVISKKAAFLKGFVTNATNPKATVFFLGIFTTVVSQTTPLSVQFTYGVWMCMVNALWFIVVAYLFTLNHIRMVFLQRKKWFEITMGIILIALALRLFITI